MLNFMYYVLKRLLSSWLNVCCQNSITWKWNNNNFGKMWWKIRLVISGGIVALLNKTMFPKSNFFNAFLYISIRSRYGMPFPSQQPTWTSWYRHIILVIVLLMRPCYIMSTHLTVTNLNILQLWQNDFDIQLVYLSKDIYIYRSPPKICFNHDVLTRKEL